MVVFYSLIVILFNTKILKKSKLQDTKALKNIRQKETYAHLWKSNGMTF
jgi:hypothetical protein